MGPVLAATSTMELILVFVYLLAILGLGWLGYKRTKNASDYLVAGRNAHPFVMAMSYGATFISTSAIVGFGGVAGMFGMGTLWLTVLNIFVGIFISFVFIGGRTRRMGHHLGAHTFAELLGKRYQSKTIQVLAGIIITIFMPLYSAAVLIGGCEFITSHFQINYNVSLFMFGLIVAAYVISGGLKGVMYTDALQGSIMLVSMVVLLFMSYKMFGGITAAHEEVAAMSDQVFVGFKAIGHRGWTRMPEFGWGDPKYDLWWILVSSIVCGVGFGVLAQPQLSVRFMTVKGQQELNRGVMIGSIFILLMTGTAFVVATLSNAYFYNKEVITGKLIADEQTAVIAKKTRLEEKSIPCRLLHIDTTGDMAADVHIIAGGIEIIKDGKVVGDTRPILPKAEIVKLENGNIEVKPRATAFMRSVTSFGQGRWMLNTDSIIPEFIGSALPKWFGTLLLLTLLAAGMSTLSSQFHTLGSSFGHDVFVMLTQKKESVVNVTRFSILAGMLIAIWLSLVTRGGYIVARATAIFFGVCLSSFLPALIGGLYFKRVTRIAALGSMITGVVVTIFWLLLVKSSEAVAIGLVQIVTDGKSSILEGHHNWPNVDPCFVALPLSLLVFIILTLATKPSDDKHLEKCFSK
jgi:solute:Na+ symporter, SSS family